MANIMDYLDWRGDLDFMQSEFNEVDNLILSELVYVDFSGIVPKEGQITLTDAEKKFFEQHTDEEIEEKVSRTKMAAFLMRKMAKTRRFGNIVLANYMNEIDMEKQSQFCAMTVKLEDGSLNVVYCGTDSTIVGWKEDFNMCFLEYTPGQIKAVEYLKKATAGSEEMLRLMGHSKGGNLSVYAAAHCGEKLRNRIGIIYNNDGPGFTDSFIKTVSYHKILPKIHTIIPESSIVGMLFEHEEEFEVVKSNENGAGQHDVMSWEVLGSELVHISKVDEKALVWDKTIRSWIDGMDGEQRELFVDTLFGILEEAEIRTVDDLAKMSPAKFVELLKANFSLKKEDQEMLKSSLWSFIQQRANALYDLIFKH